MKEFLRMLLGIVLMFGAHNVAFAQQEKKDDRQGQKERVMNTKEKIVEVVLEAFKAVERHDRQRLLELYHPEVEFHWPPSLPPWSEAWGPLQPTEAERRMDPRVVAANEETGEVVVLWRQRGVSPAGDRFDGEVLGLYQVHDGKFARAQMFYFDTVAVENFLANAKSQAAAK